MLFPRVGRKQPHVRLAWWLVVAVLSLGVFLHLLPFYFMMISSFKGGVETVATPPTLWPEHPTLAAWRLMLFLVDGQTALMPTPYIVYFKNSLVQVGLTLLFSLPITAFAAYANSKLQRGPMARWTFLYFITMLMVPATVTLLPSLLLTLHFPFAFSEVPLWPGSTEDPLPTIQIWDTPWAVVVPGLFNAFNFLLFKGFFDTIPNSVLQAARVDGGSEFNIFRRIVVPMSVPVIAVAAWMQFNAVWDGNFLWASLVFRSDDQLPTSVAIYNVIQLFTKGGLTTASTAASQKLLMDAGLTWNGLMVLGLLQTFPVFVMFIVCREYLLKGIRIRGLK